MYIYTYIETKSSLFWCLDPQGMDPSIDWSDHLADIHITLHEVEGRFRVGVRSV